ncbi:hypothetical protein ACIBH1_48910 [Nonomuraea sp. NPDC050663]|uniref:hypothetical protein n=1 Tax=Nonomuraea sp. NPDC050663 TaxID=3364370 RepID=UPI0037B5E881
MITYGWGQRHVLTEPDLIRAKRKLECAAEFFGGKATDGCGHEVAVTGEAARFTMATSRAQDQCVQFLIEQDKLREREERAMLCNNFFAAHTWGRQLWPCIL